VRIDGYWEPIPLNQIQALRPGDYHELRIESRTVVLEHADDPRLLSRLDGSLSDLIVKLKAVMAF
jgi:hypothetical protein